MNLITIFMEPMTKSQYFSKESSREIQSEPLPRAAIVPRNAKKLTEVDLVYHPTLPEPPLQIIYISFSGPPGKCRDSKILNVSKVTTRPSNFADRTSPESAFTVRDVRGGGGNNGQLRASERKRGIFITCSGREGGEGPAVSPGKRWRANVRDWWADCLSRKTERLVKWQLNARSSPC